MVHYCQLVSYDICVIRISHSFWAVMEQTVGVEVFNGPGLFAGGIIWEGASPGSVEHNFPVIKS